MSDLPGYADEVLSIDHYTGGDPCHYGCGAPAEFVVQVRAGQDRYTFAGCQDCLNGAAIWPIKNEWVDEFTGGVELS